MTLLRTLFEWPDGIVVGNLIASALWATPALWHLHKRLGRQHAEHMTALAQRLQAPADLAAVPQVRPEHSAAEVTAGGGPVQRPEP